jgi:hypothetical protein
VAKGMLQIITLNRAPAIDANPCFTGKSTFAVAAAIVELPNPDSYEKIHDLPLHWQQLQHLSQIHLLKLISEQMPHAKSNTTPVACEKNGYLILG